MEEKNGQKERGSYAHTADFKSGRLCEESTISATISTASATATATAAGEATIGSCCHSSGNCDVAATVAVDEIVARAVTVLRLVADTRRLPPRTYIQPTDNAGSPLHHPTTTSGRVV